MFAQAGISIAVADAVKEVKDAATYITRNKGGDGAVREVCELILHSQDKWTGIISAYLGKEK